MMIKRVTGITIATVVLAGACLLPGLAAARGGGDRDGDHRDFSSRQGGWGRDGGGWDGDRRGRDWGHHHGHRGHGPRTVVVERPVYGWRQAPVVVPWQPAPVIAPWGGSRNGVTVILRNEW